VGPKLEAASVKLREAAPPSSMMAAGSLSDDCAKAVPRERQRHASSSDLVGFRADLAVFGRRRLVVVAAFYCG